MRNRVSKTKIKPNHRLIKVLFDSRRYHGWVITKADYPKTRDLISAVQKNFEQVAYTDCIYLLGLTVEQYNAALKDQLPMVDTSALGLDALDIDIIRAITSYEFPSSLAKLAIERLDNESLKLIYNALIARAEKYRARLKKGLFQIDLYTQVICGEAIPEFWKTKFEIYNLENNKLEAVSTTIPVDPTTSSTKSTPVNSLKRKANPLPSVNTKRSYILLDDPTIVTIDLTTEKITPQVNYSEQINQIVELQNWTDRQSGVLEQERRTGISILETFNCYKSVIANELDIYQRNTFLSYPLNLCLNTELNLSRLPTHPVVPCEVYDAVHFSGLPAGEEDGYLKDCFLKLTYLKEYLSRWINQLLAEILAANVTIADFERELGILKNMNENVVIESSLRNQIPQGSYGISPMPSLSNNPATFWGPMSPLQLDAEQPQPTNTIGYIQN